MLVEHVMCVFGFIGNRAIRSVTNRVVYVLLIILQEADYFTPQGEFRVDSAGSQTLLNCLMYKLSYYRFGELQVSNLYGIKIHICF